MVRPAYHGGHFDPNSTEAHNGGATAAHGGAYTPSPSAYHPYQPQQYPTTQAPPMASANSAYTATEPIKSSPQVHQNIVMEQKHDDYTIGYANLPTGNSQQDSFMEPKGPVVMNVAPITEYNEEEKEFPIVLKGSRHFFGNRSNFRWYNPIVYQQPGYQFNDNERVHRHRDYAGRVSHHTRSDRYLHHIDGHLRNMYVACSDEIYDGPGTSTWKRTYIRKVASHKIRFATWVIDFSYDPKSWADWGVMILRAFPAAIAMTFWAKVIRRNLLYAPVLYTYHGNPKVWSNMLENRRGLSSLARNNQTYNLLKPRHLCFLRDPFTDELHGVDIRDVSQWEATDGEDAVLSYLFVGYSAEQFSHGSEEDMIALHHIAETACRAAKLPAYWIACSCMRDNDQLESDVYRIADVLRGAQSMIIAVGRRKSADSAARANTDTLLKEWGSRMWTFPELLLAPGKSVQVFTRGGNLKAPMIVPKNQFAARVWTYIDPHVARQLIDHYLGNISLSRLELAVLALKCLYSRHTTEYLAGDQAYALMGLLRMRPQIDRTDSAFQAFSRLSLANDSDSLLERYICTLPPNHEQPWFQMDDAYQSSLWDITPYCQVAGIAEDDTIIIDGAWGVAVRWKSFYPVYWSAGLSWKRLFAAITIQFNGMVFILAVTLMALGSSVNGSYRTSTGDTLIGIGVIFLLLFLYSWIMTPTMTRVLYGGKFSDVQAEMFGFEGHLNAPTIERAIFGGHFGRFSWSPNGSPLSRSYVNAHGEIIGMDPCRDPEVRMKVENAKRARPGDMRVFTLVDTYNMQLTLFEAVRPPQALMFCASEGGMQRAIGCSYDWTSSTMCRETVLRMPTTMLNRMDRVPRFKLGIRRHEFPSHPVNGAV
ncbi:hypothetical protein S7711_03333 [Stachybotrys chartarum IBT 7711]|uniref:3-hydroxyisobutyrate dehydrogenase protein n=1 Tax=Stachybotrys chartarum (strain CBS 109288 / IBT 7711) TaxID=1280523 RepID=A0A084AUQ4_STACB|nr:hypothetical protein S7711_03333 [Stachybotrys chartarum IBT 7711]KFA52807.1 hypothetical protein S40293_00876 [Stachybotrys chartarum IBT 40293]